MCLVAGRLFCSSSNIIHPPVKVETVELDIHQFVGGGGGVYKPRCCGGLCIHYARILLQRGPHFPKEFMK